MGNHSIHGEECAAWRGTLNYVPAASSGVCPTSSKLAEDGATAGEGCREASRSDASPGAGRGVRNRSALGKDHPQLSSASDDVVCRRAERVQFKKGQPECGHEGANLEFDGQSHDSTQTGRMSQRSDVLAVSERPFKDSHNQPALKVSHSYGGWHGRHPNSASTIAANPKLGSWSPVVMPRLERYDDGTHSLELHARGEASSWRTSCADDDRTPPLLSVNSEQLIGLYASGGKCSSANANSARRQRHSMPGAPSKRTADSRDRMDGHLEEGSCGWPNGVGTHNAQFTSLPSAHIGRLCNSYAGSGVSHTRTHISEHHKYATDESSRCYDHCKPTSIIPPPQKCAPHSSQSSTQGSINESLVVNSAMRTAAVHQLPAHRPLSMNRHGPESRWGATRARLRSTSAGRIEMYLKPVPKGYAVKSYGNGDRYEGELVRGKRDGYGLLFSANGEAYVGQWYNDMRSGRGLQFYTPWGRYEGEFRNDLRSGWGMLVMRRQGTYFGQFLANKKHGRGVLVHPRGEVYAEWWSHGRLLKRLWLKDLLFRARRSREEAELPSHAGAASRTFSKDRIGPTERVHPDLAAAGADAKPERLDREIRVGHVVETSMHNCSKNNVPFTDSDNRTAPSSTETSIRTCAPACSGNNMTAGTGRRGHTELVTGMARGTAGLISVIGEPDRNAALNPIAELSEMGPAPSPSSSELLRHSSGVHESDQSTKAGSPKTIMPKFKPSLGHGATQIEKSNRELNGQRFTTFDSVASTAASSMLQTSIFGASGFTLPGYSGATATDPSNPSSGCSQSTTTGPQISRRCLCPTCTARISSTSVMSAFVGAVGGVSDTLREYPPPRKRSDGRGDDLKKQQDRSDSGLVSLSSRDIVHVWSSDSHQEETPAALCGRSRRTGSACVDRAPVGVVGRSASLSGIGASNQRRVAMAPATKEYDRSAPLLSSAEEGSQREGQDETAGDRASLFDGHEALAHGASRIEERDMVGCNPSNSSQSPAALTVEVVEIGGQTECRSIRDDSHVGHPSATILTADTEGAPISKAQSGGTGLPAGLAFDRSQNVEETPLGMHATTVTEQISKPPGGRCLISPALSSCSSSSSTKDRLPELTKWSTADVAEFLCCLGLGHLRGVFQRHQIGGEELINSTEDDLENELRIRDATHRQILVQTAQALSRCETKLRFRGQPWVAILGYLREVFKECLISSSALRRCRLVGEGGFGLVYKGLWGGEAEVAIKAFRVAALTGVPAQRPAAPTEPSLIPLAKAKLGPSNLAANAGFHYALQGLPIQAGRSSEHHSNTNNATNKTSDQRRSFYREMAKPSPRHLQGDPQSTREAPSAKEAFSSTSRRRRLEDNRLAERQRHRLAFMLLDLADEAKVLMTLRHPNVTRFWGVCLDLERQWLVTQFVSGGSLFRLIHSSRGVLLDSLRITKIALGICSGMAYVHARGLLHCDLKSPNVLLDETLEPKICDFGLALRTLDCPAAAARGRIGTPQWMAPEILRGAEYSKAADVFSFGVVMWEMLSRRVPHGNLTINQVMAAVGWGNHRLEPVYHCPDALSSLMKRCIHRVPSQRPTFQELVKEFADILTSGVLETDSSRLLAKPLRRFKEQTRLTLGSVEQMIFGPPL